MGPWCCCISPIGGMELKKFMVRPFTPVSGYLLTGSVYSFGIKDERERDPDTPEHYL